MSGAVFSLSAACTDVVTLGVCEFAQAEACGSLGSYAPSRGWCSTIAELTGDSFELAVYCLLPTAYCLLLTAFFGFPSVIIVQQEQGREPIGAALQHYDHTRKPEESSWQKQQ